MFERKRELRPRGAGSFCTIHEYPHPHAIEVRLCGGPWFCGPERFMEVISISQSDCREDTPNRGSDYLPEKTHLNSWILTVSHVLPRIMQLDVFVSLGL